MRHNTLASGHQKSPQVYDTHTIHVSWIMISQTVAKRRHTLIHTCTVYTLSPTKYMYMYTIQWNLTQQSLSKVVGLLTTGSMQGPKNFANTYSTLIHLLNGHSLLWIVGRPVVPIATNTVIHVPSSKVADSPSTLQYRV